jgi:hypothetical protein
VRVDTDRRSGRPGGDQGRLSAAPTVGTAGILAARLNSARFIFRETSKTRAGRAGNLDKSSAS